MVDHCLIIVAFFVEVDEVGHGPLSLCWTVLHVVSQLATFKAGIVGGARCHLGDVASCCSPLLSPTVRSPGMAEIHWDRLVVEHWRGIGRVDQRCPVSNGVAVSSGVGWHPPPHRLLGVLEEGWGRWPSLWPCVPPVSSVWSPGVTLGSKHALNDLTGPGCVDCLLFHLLVSCRKGGFHYFSGNRAGETLKEEVSTFIVACSVVHKME